MIRNSLVRRPFSYNYRHYTLWLIAINVFVFALKFILGSAMDGYLAMTPILVLSGFFWQPLTYMFVHANLTHLLVNMLGLLFSGQP